MDNKRLGVRLAQETLLGINELKKELVKDEIFQGIRITNGLVVSQAYLETKNFDKKTWEVVVKKNLNSFFDGDVHEKLNVVTNLYLEEDVINGIMELKHVLVDLSILKVSYVTVSYAIRQMIKGYFLKRHGILQNCCLNCCLINWSVLSYEQR